MPRKSKTLKTKKVSDVVVKLGKVKQVRPGLKPGKAKFAFICAEFNEYFTKLLLEGAVDTLKRCGVAEANIKVFYVPGAFEIPLVVQRIQKSGKFDAVITIGMVIRGQTRHFSQVVDGAAEGSREAALKSDVPVIHAVVAAENLEQAINRTGGKLGHKGREAAEAALKMVNLLKEIK